ncbi:MAG: sensor histidine kinase [Candidatus Accumulibacter sp.]|nr:sensor histidine kinase [Accumulibacter sp.]MCM8611199.1 sensor histidine kinase [Accumulibacter sp.]MCM8634345.1 sensor histidine kinase [Accumulibacter sp.]MCM8641623.1 sensor histidine kinase [Accumulibacter sp.]
MRRRGSLRIRLVAGTLVWITVTIVAAGWALGNLFRDHVAGQFHAELRTQLDQLTAHLTLDAEGRASLALPLGDPRLSRPYSGSYWQVDGVVGVGGVGAGVLRSRSLWDRVLVVPQDTPADGEVHQHRIAGPQGRMLGMAERTIAIEDGADGTPHRFRLIAAADEAQMDEPVARFQGALWLSLGVLALGLAFAVLVQVGVGLSPLRRLRQDLERIRKGEAQHLVDDHPAEIAPLVEEFNSVLAQNSSIVERARTQAGNLAHAVKTPLSVLANAANARQDDFARLVAEQVGVARRQVDYHLARAQAAAAVSQPGLNTSLPAALDGLMRTMRQLHAGCELKLEMEPPTVAWGVRVELHDLQEMLGNLLDNACKWARRRVVIDVSRSADGIRIDIDDDGDGIAAEHCESVLRRGVRADQRVPGAGLGLAIVDELAHLYGGRLSLTRSPLGGLRATLLLPANG